MCPHLRGIAREIFQGNQEFHCRLWPGYIHVYNYAVTVVASAVCINGGHHAVYREEERQRELERQQRELERLEMEKREQEAAEMRKKVCQSFSQSVFVKNFTYKTAYLHKLRLL